MIWFKYKMLYETCVGRMLVGAELDGEAVQRALLVVHWEIPCANSSLVESLQN